MQSLRRETWKRREKRSRDKYIRLGSRGLGAVVTGTMKNLGKILFFVAVLVLFCMSQVADARRGNPNKNGKRQDVNAIRGAEDAIENARKLLEGGKAETLRKQKASKSISMPNTKEYIADQLSQRRARVSENQGAAAKAVVDGKAL